MKKLCQCLLAFLMVLNLFLSYSVVSNATGTTMMYLSTNSPKVGDTVKLTVTGSASSTITIKYTDSVLTFASCDAGGYTQSGNSVTFTGKTGNINFTAATAGSANIIVSSNSLSGCSTQITVSGTSETASTENVTTSPETATEEETSEEQTTEENVESETPEVDTSVQKLGNEEHFVIVMAPDTLPNDALVESTYLSDADTFTLYQFSDVANEFYYVYGENEQGVVGWYEFDSSTGQVFRANTDVLRMVGTGEGFGFSENSEFSEFIDYAIDYVKDNYRNILAILILLIAVIVVIRINIRVFKKNAENDDDDDGSDIFADLDSPKKDSLFSRVENEEDDEDDEEGEDDEDIPTPPLDLSVVNDALDEEDEEDDEEEEDEEGEDGGRHKGLFFKRKKNEDIWAEYEEDYNEEEKEEEQKVKISAKASKKDSSSASNREINLMDLNNL